MALHILKYSHLASHIFNICNLFKNIHIFVYLYISTSGFKYFLTLACLRAAQDRKPAFPAIPGLSLYGTESPPAALPRHQRPARQNCCCLGAAAADAITSKWAEVSLLLHFEFQFLRRLQSHPSKNFRDLGSSDCSGSERSSHDPLPSGDPSLPLILLGGIARVSTGDDGLACCRHCIRGGLILQQCVVVGP